MPGVQPNQFRYLRSIADELYSQSKRVRDLIGEAHWLSDGRHKEYLLTALIRRHLPSATLAGPGFVVSPGNVGTCSCEQDLLIVDTFNEAPLFSQGGLIVAFPSTVLAAVSVKTKLDNETVEEAVEGLNTVRLVAADLPSSHPAIWCGGYFFEERESALKNASTILNYIEASMQAHPVPRPELPSPSMPGPDAFATAYNVFVRFDYASSQEADHPETARLLAHGCDGMASAVFLSHLLNHIALARGSDHAGLASLADTPLEQLPNSPRTITLKSEKVTP